MIFSIFDCSYLYLLTIVEKDVTQLPPFQYNSLHFFFRGSSFENSITKIIYLVSLHFIFDKNTMHLIESSPI